MASLPAPRPLTALVADDRLSDEVKTLLRDAAGEAARLGHRLIGGEHLLLALIASPGATGAMLRAAGATTAQTRSRIEFIVPHEPAFLAVGGEIRVAPRVVAMIEDAAEVAASLDEHVEAPDLLIALLRPRDSVPVRVLDECGVNTRALRQGVRR